MPEPPACPNVKGRALSAAQLKQLQTALVETARAAGVSNVEALAELVRASLLSESHEVGHAYGPDFIKLLDVALIK